MRWLKLPEFQVAYREARRAAYSQAVAKLQQGATTAATTPLKVDARPGTPASVKVRAAECVMTHSSKAIEIEDIEAKGSQSWNARPGHRKPANEDRSGEATGAPGDCAGLPGKQPSPSIEFAYLKQLPREYTGPSHIVTVGRRPDGREELAQPLILQMSGGVVLVSIY